MLKMDDLLYENIQIQRSICEDIKYFVFISTKNGISKMIYEGFDFGKALQKYSGVKNLIESKEIIEIY